MALHVSREDRFVGCLLGLAVGDALGSHFEGQSPDSIHNRYAVPEALIQDPPKMPWRYTDDTQMAIGVAEALLKDHEVVEQSLCEAFAANYVPSRGYSHGTRLVLDAIRDGLDYRRWTNEYFPGGSFGNGAAMRVAPIGLVFHHDQDRLWEQARLSSLPTHVHPLGIEGAQLMALSVAICVNNPSIDKSNYLTVLHQSAETGEFQKKLQFAKKTVSRKDLARLGNGFAAQDSVVTAVSCFLLWPDSYEEAVSNAILLGGDTDTIAAMTGAISGAHLGVQAIPSNWINGLENDSRGRSYIVQLAQQLSTVLR